VKQGKEIASVHDNIKDFQIALCVWETQVKNENLEHFVTCKSFKKKNLVTVKCHVFITTYLYIDLQMLFSLLAERVQSVRTHHC
jgi:hypothetical protein